MASERVGLMAQSSSAEKPPRWQERVDKWQEHVDNMSPRFARGPGPARTHKIAIGLTGDPVPVGSRSGATTHRNDQRPSRSHHGASSSNWR
jgi:hypothetical protein